MDPRFTKLTANVPHDVMLLLDALVARYQPFATRHAVHVLALRLGLAELITNPERVREETQHEGTGT